MDQAKIIEIINENQDGAFFVGKADENCVRGIEERLNVSLSISYKWFLKEFGHGGFNGVEVLGSGLSVIPTCVIETEDWRNFELPQEYVVIENSGSGAIYCLDTSRMSNNECPVIMWTQYDGVIGPIFNNFYEFLFYRFI
ncbi:SMI1/KNR4 family protein [Bacillus sp. 3255]|uniref:SMI1/KNR4 family protein n=1 Tax=Bacillus sp. 3255 TaxID=2817904 RepID=UPI002861A8C1|nr:SMI1/KNR4 family protein [Bacillus sp. 3255]MDR6883570.1 hypothetical protein [Bacillus sp. 3255]